MRYSEIIKEAALDAESLDGAYDIISRYVSHGEVQPDYRARIADDFRDLMTIIPRPKQGMKLYRFLRLSDEQAATLRAGSLVLEMNEFSSWTKNFGAAELIARKKQGKGHPVIVSARFPAREIVVDVPAFYEENSFNNPDFDEYGMYVRSEQEVIVTHHAPIRLTPENTRFLERTVRVEPPKIGDRFFWDEEVEDSQDIEDVDHDQPYADRGIFNVTPEGHHTSEPVHSIGPGEWQYIKMEQ